MKKKYILSILFMLTTIVCFGQDETTWYNPTVTYYDSEKNDTVTIKLSKEDAIATLDEVDAPKEIFCHANISCPSNISESHKWTVYSESDSGSTIYRTEDEFSYTIQNSGATVVKFSIWYTDAEGNETEDSLFAKVSIKTSKLEVCDFFNPDHQSLKITCQSIVKCKGIIFNRWGQCLHTFTVENLSEGWDGKVNGKSVNDGVYFINLNAFGSDGTHYKIKKAINVLKGYREDTETSTDN